MNEDSQTTSSLPHMFSTGIGSIIKLDFKYKQDDVGK